MKNTEPMERFAVTMECWNEYEDFEGCTTVARTDSIDEARAIAKSVKRNPPQDGMKNPRILDMGGIPVFVK